jgi:outer membrane protein OmpA-like peptidoglycan-associated protein
MRRIFLFSIFVVFSTSVFATKYAAEFTDLGVGVRPAGMGGAFTTFNGDLQAIWWNPAGIEGLSDRPQFYFMHAAMFDNLYQLDVGAAGKKLGGIQYAFGFFRNATENIPFTRPNGFYDYGIDRIPGTGDEGEGNGEWDPGEQIRPDAIDFFNDGDYLFTVAAGKKFGDKLSVGLSFKHLQSYIGQYSAFGFGMDAGAIYELNPRLSFGATARDFTGTLLRWSTNRVERKNPSLWLGAKYYIPLQSVRGGVAFTGDLETHFEDYDGIINIGNASIDPHIGAELLLLKHLFLRTGLDRKDFSAGVGLGISFFRVDYAFVTSADLNNTHRVGISFEVPKIVRKPKPKPEPKIEEEQPVVQKEPERKELEIKLPPPPVGEKVAEFLFETAFAELDDNAKTQLDSVCRIHLNYPTNRIYIEGHTDSIRIETKDYADNKALSDARAKNSAKYLIEKCGVPANRIVTEGFGTMRPRYTNSTEEGRAKNRRVEIYLWEP